MRRPTLIGLLAVARPRRRRRPAHAAADKPALSAKTTTCTTGADDASRAAAFTGAMPAAAQTKRMQMRFVLIQRKGTGPKGAFKKVAVPGWGGWVKSDPDRQGFVFTKRVEALTAPAGYRAVITFRWLDAKGACPAHRDAHDAGLRAARPAARPRPERRRRHRHRQGHGGLHGRRSATRATPTPCRSP